MPVGQWVSNRPGVQGRAIGAGTFGLCNAALDTPWPKVRALKQRLIHAVDQHHVLERTHDASYREAGMHAERFELPSQR